MCQRYEELFTSSGAGKLNLLDFFSEMSHGSLDLSGSEVLGWYTLDKKHSEYLGSGQNQQGRDDLITWARAAATAAGVDLTKFFNVVVSLNVPTDLYGGPGGVITHDDRSRGNGMSALSPALMGQEMTHGYGLATHSRIFGSTQDYTDPWDVMSNEGPLMAPHPFFTDLDARANPIFRLGPGLNAAEMDALGWLDESRVWTPRDGDTVDNIVELRPLHRRDLPGYLAIRFENLYIEFRMNDRWDAAILAPTVLVHTFEDGYSYLMPDNNGNSTFGVGDYWETPSNLSLFGSTSKLEVLAIDPAAQTGSPALFVNKSEEGSICEW